MNTYMLLLHESATAAPDISPEEMQKIIERYRNWSMGLREKGLMKGGQKLRDGSGRVMRTGGSGLMVTDGPYTEAKEVIAGYFEILAPDYESAVELAKTCPHLEFGTIEVREVEVT